MLFSFHPFYHARGKFVRDFQAEQELCGIFNETALFSKIRKKCNIETGTETSVGGFDSGNKKNKSKDLIQKDRYL